MKVGQWVSFKNEIREIVVGQVSKVTGNRLTVQYNDFKRNCTAHVSNFTPTSAPSEYPTIKKGMWVESRDGSCKGIVTKVSGLKLEVSTDPKNGRGVKGIHCLFKIIEAPVLDDSKIMDAYTIKKIKEAGGEETRRFEAVIYKDGKEFAHVSNSGCGGCNSYYPLNQFTFADLNEFYETAKKWFEYHAPKPFEPEDMWVEYEAFHKKIGILAKDWLTF
jgi:hypothetical protein